jgi:alcohol dehydrogenase
VLTEPRTFEYREYPLPDIGPEEGLLRVEAAGLCGTDYEQFSGHLDGTKWATRPIIPGHEIMGWVDRLGRDAAREWGVKEGDRVTVDSSIPCGRCFQCIAGQAVLCKSGLGYGIRKGCADAPYLWGGYATHMYLHPQARLHPIPDNVPTNVMSLFNPLSNAVRWMLEKPNMKVGDKVVITGPGQRGLLAVFAARMAGAGQVIITGKAEDEYRLSLAAQLGADATINVDEEDPVERVRDLTGGERADIVLDVSAFSTEPLIQALDMVRPGGTIVVAGLKNQKPLEGFVSDRLILDEISMVGVLSSGWVSVETSIAMIRRNWKELEVLCTHGYPVSEAEKAVRVLGREITDGPEAVHIHLEAQEGI